MNQLEQLNRESKSLEAKIKLVQQFATKTPINQTGQIISLAVTASIFGIIALPLSFTAPVLGALGAIGTFPRLMTNTITVSATKAYNSIIERTKTCLPKLEDKLSIVRNEINKLSNNQELVC